MYAREYALAQPHTIDTKAVEHVPEDLPGLCQAREQDVLGPDVVGAQRPGFSTREAHDATSFVFRIADHGAHLWSMVSCGARVIGEPV